MSAAGIVPTGDYAKLRIYSPFGSTRMLLHAEDAEALGRRLCSCRQAPLERSFEATLHGFRHMPGRNPLSALDPLPSPVKAESGDKLFEVGRLARHWMINRRVSTAQLERETAALEPDLVGFMRWALAEAVPGDTRAMSRELTDAIRMRCLRAFLVTLRGVQEACRELLADVDGAERQDAPRGI